MENRIIRLIYKSCELNALNCYPIKRKRPMQTPLLTWSRLSISSGLLVVSHLENFKENHHGLAGDTGKTKVNYRTDSVQDALSVDLSEMGLLINHLIAQKSRFRCAQTRFDKSPHQ